MSFRNTPIAALLLITFPAGGQESPCPTCSQT